MPLLVEFQAVSVSDNVDYDVILVNRMGRPVGDADEILRRWKIRRHELRNSMNTIILPLGKIDVGHSRHRALLFKVLADKINLPCMLVKGSYYTGTNDGAVKLIVELEVNILLI
ncbi:putative non-specific serine/threonine protein kinase [Rosa chinensis]|uniref:Putative non-specific serine/threonine protein kinase n=1 Tax=Rosa chinensis TaxID=74649 RepID=A0A2P6PRQ3_ROSCH|nr:putative non-specific serine/threonine protein kinase [Rosa chinensis]